MTAGPTTRDSAPPAISDAAQALCPVEPGYRHVLRLRMAFPLLILLVASLVLDRALTEGTAFSRLMPLAVLLIAATTLVVGPRRIHARLGYRLTESLLQVVRGWLIRVDTMVPFVRVQHIDVTRGPLDNLFGTATLVVHTAGTHNSVVTLPGLSPARAAEIRDLIREHVRTDFG